MAAVSRQRRVLQWTAAGAVIGCLVAIVIMRFIGPDPYGPDPSTTRGGDLTQFTAGARVLDQGHGARLYHRATFRAQLRVLFPPRELGYDAVYPPPIYQAFQPFVNAPWGLVTRVHGIVEALLFALAAFLLVRASGGFQGSRALATTFVAASPVFIATTDAGQLSGVWFAIVALALHTWTIGWPFAGGLILGLLWAKPTVAVVLAVVLVVTGRWRIFAGSIAGGAALGAVSWALAPKAWTAYLHSLASATSTAEQVFYRPYRHANFRALLVWAGVPSQAAIVGGAVLGLLLAIVAARLAKRLTPEDPFLTFAVALSGAAVGVPHLFEYDLWLHAPAFVAGAARLAAGTAHRPRAGIVIGTLAWWIPQMFYRPGIEVPLGLVSLLVWLAWLLAETRPPRVVASA